MVLLSFALPVLTIWAGKFRIPDKLLPNPFLSIKSINIEDQSYRRDEMVGQGKPLKMEIVVKYRTFSSRNLPILAFGIYRLQKSDDKKWSVEVTLETALSWHVLKSSRGVQWRHHVAQRAAPIRLSGTLDQGWPSAPRPGRATHDLRCRIWFDTLSCTLLARSAGLIMHTSDRQLACVYTRSSLYPLLKWR